MSFIKKVNGHYNSIDDIDRLIEYCIGSKYIQNYALFGTNVLNLTHAVESMSIIRNKFHKETGQLVQHFIFSIKPNRYLDVSHLIWYAEEVMYKVGYKLADIGFQSIGFIHAKRNKMYEAEIGPFNVHIHFIVNTINGRDGHRMQDVKNLLNSLLLDLKRDYFLKNLNWKYVYME